MTQETIKKDAEEYYNNNIFCDGITEFEHDIAIRCYIAGAKNQQERMYSEEVTQLELLIKSQEELKDKEVLTNEGVGYLNGLKTALKQFKKK